AILSRQREPLFPPELIGLTILRGEPQQSELAVLIHLKLGKSPGHLVQVDDGPEPASRHEPGDEDITIPRLELEHGPRSGKLHNERVAVLRHLRGAEARIDKIAAKR